MLFDQESIKIITIERAISDLRRGLPVVIGDNIYISPETIADGFYDLINNRSVDAKIIITKNRAKALLNKTGFRKNLVFIDINNITLNELEFVCALKDNFSALEEKITNIVGKLYNIYESNSSEYRAGVTLAKLAELVPAIIAVPLQDMEFGSCDILQKIDSSDIFLYQKTVARNLKQATSCNIKLEGDISAKIIAFRPLIGGHEHYAIIIGKPDKIPLVRVHSSCYTGDLLASLVCDCKDQLRLAIEIMANKGGGIVLYMLQEGRGIGLVNKIRAYNLKENGFDTAEANEILGFEDDERFFASAAKILNLLNINDIKLLSNNPKKGKSLEDFGINVSKFVPVKIRANQYNKDYLNTKARKFGHLLDIEN